MRYFFVVAIFVVACAQINRTERERFSQQDGLRHGLIPTDAPKAKPVKDELRLLSQKRGEALYRGLCLECHGQKGRGDGPTAKDWPVAPPDLMRTLREVPHFELYMAVSQVQGEMPGWRQPLSATDREDLANYLRQLRDMTSP